MGKALVSKGKKEINSKIVKFISGQQVVSAGCATQVWQPEFDPSYSYGGNKKALTPKDSTLTPVHTEIPLVCSSIQCSPIFLKNKSRNKLLHFHVYENYTIFFNFIIKSFF